MLSMENLLVVSIEQAVAAPICSMRLADAGARVIKVEPRGGETARRYDKDIIGESAYFVSLNRGKQSLELSLRDDQDLKLLKCILERADIFIRNTAPGTMDSVGLKSDLLLDIYKRLIVVDIFGYGQDSDYRDMKAYDLLIQAEGGLCSITGTEDDPVKVGISIADLGTGMNAYTAVLEALIKRENTGRGSHIELAMFDTVAEWMSVPLLHFEYANKFTSRHGMAHASIYPYRPYCCRDGEVIVAVQNNEQWSRFCQFVLLQKELGSDERFATNSERVLNRETIDEMISSVTRGLTVAEFQSRLKEAGTAFGRVSDIKNLSSHPALHRRAVLVKDKIVNAVASPLNLSHGVKPSRIPEIGEHNELIRREFGSNEMIP